MSPFFIDRPIFAWVIAISIMLGGLLALNTLSISQYPQITPTTINISANYPGADAQTVENSVTKVIEQGMTGIDDLDYMSATSTSTGAAQLTLTFTADADPDVAQMQVQNKLQLVTSQLPSIVQTNGLSVTKASTGYLLVIGFVSADGKMSSTDLADYVESSLNDTLRRLEGVGETRLFGSGYAMRIWLDPALQILANHQRREIGHRGAKHPGLGWPARRPAGSPGPAAQRDGNGEEPTGDARTVPQHHLEKRHQRVGGTAA